MDKRYGKKEKPQLPPIMVTTEVFAIYVDSKNDYQFSVTLNVIKSILYRLAIQYIRIIDVQFVYALDPGIDCRWDN